MCATTTGDLAFTHLDGVVSGIATSVIGEITSYVLTHSFVGLIVWCPVGIL